MKRLSIIIPAYNAEPYLGELLDCLAKQVTDEVEVLVIDDGSRTPVRTDHKFCKVIHKKNGGCASARNRGIDKATGEYISFIDADDLVSERFISTILKKTKDDKPDVIELSWKSLNQNGYQHDYKLNSDSDRLSNPSVCTRVWKRAFIGDNRFNEQKDSTEDEDFSRHIGVRQDGDYKRAVICDYMYFYRTDVSNSKIKRFKKGLMKTKRVTYFYKHVSEDMRELLMEIKKEDLKNEVWLLTYQCDIPELKKYCQITNPQRIWTHYLRGEPYGDIEIINPPLRTQVVIYRKYCYVIGGLMTFIQEFCDRMYEYYDITVVTDKMDARRQQDLMSKVRVLVNKPEVIVSCDTLIVLSFLDKLPENIIPKRVVRMCHACKTDPSWQIPKDYDELVYVSGTAMETHGDKESDNIHVIHNMVSDRAEDVLMLVSATRLPADDKGDIETRMRKLAEMLNAADIKYIWLNFADGKLKDAPPNFYNMGITLDIQSYIRKADYVVQLSDSEAWSYTVLESLTLGTPLICTPFPSAFEQGVKDGVNAHVIPFNMDFDVRKLLDIPRVRFEYDNERIVDQWREVLGDTKPQHDYVPDKMILIEVTKDFDDMELDRRVTTGSRYLMRQSRAEHIIRTQSTLIKIVRGI